MPLLSRSQAGHPPASVLRGPTLRSAIRAGLAASLHDGHSGSDVTVSKQDISRMRLSH